MYRKAVNESSPMRVFERSMHGGLGRGHLGVVISAPGLGKSALLAQIALDDLLHDKKVLHISHEHSVKRVRAQYDDVFHELASARQLCHSETMRLELERRRLIYSHFGGTPNLSIGESVAFATNVAQFEADAIIIEGFDFATATPGSVEALRVLCKEKNVEMWLSAKSKESAAESARKHATAFCVPAELAPFVDQVDVIVALKPSHDGVVLQLMKEHDNSTPNELSLRLDSTTMRVIDGALPQQTPKAADPSRFHLFSGGARGAEYEFGRCAERWGIKETHFSFEGHPFLEREKGVVKLGDDELRRGDFSLVYASHRLDRPLSEIPNIKRILQTVWHQISAASEVFVVGALQDTGTVRGGTGWGAELARLWSKPVRVFDQVKGCWYRWDATVWRVEKNPSIGRTAFAGIGTTRLTPEGRAAIHALFDRTFGPEPD